MPGSKISGAAHAVMSKRGLEEIDPGQNQSLGSHNSFLSKTKRVNVVQRIVGGMAGVIGATTRTSSANSSNVHEFNTENPTQQMQEASSTIARYWWKHRYREYLERKHFLARLELEDSLGRRIVRLVVNSLIFVFLVRFLSLGNPASEKLSVRTLLTGHLFNKQFYRIRTLDDLRDYLPLLSEKARKFSVSAPTAAKARQDTSLRVGSVLQGERRLFSGPLRLYAFQPRLTSPFSFAAWIEHPVSGSGVNSSEAWGLYPIVRQPMSSTRALSCWGWYFPPQLRYGAHDFYSSTSTENEEVVRAEGWAFVGGDASHEVVTVDQGVATFYSNGEQVGEARSLPRKLTECTVGAAIEMGDDGMALSSFKFYQRALTPSEVQELYLGGQPLVELAAGTDLQEEAVDFTALDTDKEEVLAELQSVSVEGQVQSTMLAEPVNGSGHAGWVPVIDPTFPPDPSPAAWLPGGAAKVAKLPAVEREAWERGGSKVNASGRAGFLTEEWREDAEIGRRFYSVFEEPIYGDGTTVATLPEFDAGLDGATVSFWMRSLQAKRLYGPHLRLWQSTPEDAYGIWSDCTADAPETSDLSFRVQLDWVTIAGRAGQECKATWWFLTWFDPEIQDISEDFLVSAFAQEPEPLVWRHMAYRFDVARGGWAFFLDGRLVLDTAVEGMSGPARYSKGQNVHRLLSGAKVTPHSWTGGSDYENVPAKIAQLRVYEGSLAASEILGLQDSAVWPGVGAPLKECIDPETDFRFADTAIRDNNGHNCQWHQSHVGQHPHVCQLDWLKRMCAVTCAGRRKCHGGQLSPRPEAKVPARRFQVFDRIMHVVPQRKSVLCPRRDLDAAAAADRCRVLRASWGAGYGGGDNYSSFYERTFEEVRVSLADLRECDELEAALQDGGAQCAWDPAGIEEFEEEVEAQGGRWSLTFWIRPKESSLGMPSNFWFGVNLYASVSPPLVLSHWNEIQPKKEPWMDTFTTVLDPSGGVDSARAAIYPTTSIDYTKWTMMHMQMEPHDGAFRMCATLNNLPMVCTEEHGPRAWERFSPGGMLEALELSTEMLVSPLEFTTGSFSPSEVQRLYYKDAPQMAMKLGPRGTLRDGEGEEVASEVELPDSDLRLALLAPPVLFQSRATPAACDSAVAQPFIDAQLDLLQASFCFGSSCPGLSARTVAACPSDVSESRQFWGRSRTKLRSEEGYAEFLSVIADNPMVVRSLEEGEPPVMLDTRQFLDGLTKGVRVIMLLLNPQSGLITLIEVAFDVSQPSVRHKIKISHLGTVIGHTQRRSVWIEFAVLLLLLLLFFALNFFSLRRLRREARAHRSGTARGEFTEVVYGLIECCMVLAFAVWWLVSTLLSEEASKTVVRRVAGVEWTSQDLGFDDKVSSLFAGVGSFDRALSANFVLQTIAFFLLLLMLLSIMQATAVHPKMRALTGSFMKSIDDLWHFTILAAVIFTFFATTGWWTFGGDREDFRTGTETMTTQVNIILGVLPVDFNRDFRLSTYVMLTTAVFFLLMLNFLLAIVVEGYMKVRGEMTENKAAYEFFTDMFLTAQSSFVKRIERWPSRRELIWVITNYMPEGHALNGKMLRDALVRNGEQGPTLDGVRKAFDYYWTNFPPLRTAAPTFDFNELTRRLGALHGIDLARAPGKDARRSSYARSTDAGIASRLDDMVLQMQAMAREMVRMREDLNVLKAEGNGVSHLGNGVATAHPGSELAAQDPPKVTRRRRKSATSDAIEQVVEHPRRLSITSLSADLVLDHSSAPMHASARGDPEPPTRYYLRDEAEFSYKNLGTVGGHVAPTSSVYEERGSSLQGAEEASTQRMRELAKMASRSQGSTDGVQFRHLHAETEVGVQLENGLHLHTGDNGPDVVRQPLPAGTALWEPAAQRAEAQLVRSASDTAAATADGQHGMADAADLRVGVA